MPAIANEDSSKRGGAHDSSREIFEIKYASPRHIRNILLSRLRHNADVPKQFSSAKMKTTYFDDRTNSSFYESKDGELEKRKYRLREYVDAVEGADYSLEIKMRSNTVTKKVKRLIYGRLPQGYRLTTFSGLIATFERTLGISLAELYVELPSRELTPSAVICYDRSRFDDRREDVRYNVDTNIMVCFDAKRANNEHGHYLDHDIFEIKSPQPGFFPSFLGDFGLEPFSFSKFLWGKETIMEAEYWSNNG